MKLAISILMVAIVAIAAAEKITYKGYKLIRLFPTDDEQLNYLHKLEDQDIEVTHWIYSNSQRNAWHILIKIISKPKRKDWHMGRSFERRS